MSRLLKELSKVGPFLYRGPGKMWVSASTLKCMYTNYVQKQIDKQLEMPWAINRSLSYLLKEGLAEIRPTQTGRELAKAFLESYKVSHERWEREAGGEGRYVKSCEQDHSVWMELLHVEFMLM